MIKFLNKISEITKRSNDILSDCKNCGHSGTFHLEDPFQPVGRQRPLEKYTTCRKCVEEKKKDPCKEFIPT